MSACEMCGSNDASIKAEVEGVILSVCHACAHYGKVISQPRSLPQKKDKAQPKDEIIEGIVDDYAQKIRDARQKHNLTQEEFAKKLNQRASSMQKIESGRQKPEIALARKLERLLNITLVEQETLHQIDKTAGKTVGVTIGDMLKRM